MSLPPLALSTPASGSISHLGTRVGGVRHTALVSRSLDLRVHYCDAGPFLVLQRVQTRVIYH